jgi:hypothetical protein
MARNFLACDRDQELLLPPSLREWLPEGHLAWFVIDASRATSTTFALSVDTRRRASSSTAARAGARTCGAPSAGCA